MAFWDGTKKSSLGHHHLAFVGKKLRDHSELDRQVVRCELSGPPTYSESGRCILGHCAILGRFATETRNRVWGITVRLLWARNFKITQNQTAQWLDVNFRGIRPRFKYGPSFLGHCAFLRRFGTEPRNRVWGVTVGICGQETSRSLRIGPLSC